MKKLPVEGRIISITHDRIVAVQGEQVFTYNRAYYEIIPQTFHDQTA
ncbi:hypothetical protein [Alkalihalobacillus sp. TS-13]|nr:hypothetical protein [Alkalihalobacillus sp. TS-13]